MDISVVLCTYNNAERLRITLQSFCRLNEPEKLDWELVAVNNNSTDNTETVIRSFNDQLPIRYVYEPEQGLSRARNAGLDVAEGELIVFTDDDVKPNPDWLTAYWAAYRGHPEGYYFGGPIESEYEEAPPSEELLDLAPPSVKGLDWGNEECELVDGSFIAANWACPAKYIDRAEAFNPSLGLNSEEGSVGAGEETDLMYRLQEKGVKPWYLPEASIKHYVPSSKCTIEHIASRMEKIAYSSHIGDRSTSVKTVLGIPFGIFLGALLSVVKITLKIKYKKSYVEWRSFKGSVRGYFRSD